MIKDGLSNAEYADFLESLPDRGKHLAELYKVFSSIKTQTVPTMPQSYITGNFKTRVTIGGFLFAVLIAPFQAIFLLLLSIFGFWPYFLLMLSVTIYFHSSAYSSEATSLSLEDVLGIMLLILFILLSGFIIFARTVGAAADARQQKIDKDLLSATEWVKKYHKSSLLYELVTVYGLTVEEVTQLETIEDLKASLSEIMLSQVDDYLAIVEYFVSRMATLKGVLRYGEVREFISEGDEETRRNKVWEYLGKKVKAFIKSMMKEEVKKANHKRKYPFL